MNREDHISEAKRGFCTKEKASKVVSRRSFIQSLGVIQAGSIFFSTGSAKQVKGQSISTNVGSLSKQQLVDMYTDMLKIRLWETKIKDLALKGGFRGVAHLYVG